MTAAGARGLHGVVARNVRNVVALGRRVLRSGGRLDLLSSLLAVVAIAVSVATLSATLAVHQGMTARAERTAWRYPVEAADDATAIQAVSTDFVRGRPIVQVDLAAIGPPPPPPPGMARLPRPGQLALSPALADLLSDLPAGQLASRFATDRTNDVLILGRDALAHSEELVAVRGRAPGDPVMTARRLPDPRREGDVVPPTPISGFASDVRDFSTSALYVGTAQIAAVLVVVPVLVLIGATARLRVARRNRRLATLRLLGATPLQVMVMTVAEALVTTGLGILGGLVLYAAAVPLMADVVTGGGPWYLPDLVLGLPGLAGVVLITGLLAIASAVAILRQVIIGPLGVTQRQTPAALRAGRVVAFVIALTAFGTLSTADDVALTSILVVLTATFGALALAGFVAGFLAPVDFGQEASPWGPADRLELTVPAAELPHTMTVVRQRLATADVDAQVSTIDTFTPGAEETDQTVAVTVAGVSEQSPDESTALDRARTALAGVIPGQPAVTGHDVNWVDRMLGGDYQTFGLLVLGAAFVIGIASAGITSAASVLDRRRSLQLLRLIGAPLPLLSRMRRAEILLPMVLTGLGAVTAGLAAAAPYTVLAGAPVDVRGVVVLAVAVAAGFAGTVLAIAASQPLLREVTQTLDVNPE